MRRDEALNFLSQHQPMPDNPPVQLLASYKTATATFYEDPDPACIPLLLNSFSEWNEWLVYDFVQCVIRRFSFDQVLPHLVAGLRGPTSCVRFWCADTARFFPDECLVNPLGELLRNGTAELRLAAASALKAIDSERARAVAKMVLPEEKDERVRTVLESFKIQPLFAGALAI